MGGRPLDPKATYRVATSNFLAEGGDDRTTSWTALTQALYSSAEFRYVP